MKTGAVIVCAGKGARFGRDKACVKVNGAPLFVHACRTFLRAGGIDQVVLVLRREHFSRAEEWFPEKKVRLAEGGACRTESVRNGLDALKKTIRGVLIHDGARPFVSPELIGRVISALDSHEAVICGIRSRDTLKTVDSRGYVNSTLNRNSVYAVQTPQGFRRKMLRHAYANAEHKEYFDDAQLVEQTGGKVKVIEGERKNVKITFPEDLDFFRGKQEGYDR
ncbi:MAG: 2-C-methyl-D-erythritol 4-phosphate cytidylyltransferase [Candidatus Omnitrophica bacterium]|nr:2-C-methyl-D-erythritol 4-phosphate cytidylyltransferase [Candidatus Omnitrophota bacterium]